nr:helix-turn-helix domain-containing protein [Stenotrophomonas indicatrix]
MYYKLTEPERSTLSVLKRQGCSLRGIARILERHPSTISREVRRNATVAQGKPRPLYVPSEAQEHANGRRSRSRRVKQHGHLVYAQVESLLVQ